MRLFCWHVWELIEKIRVNNDEGFYTKDDFILQCKKCGDIKKRRL